MDKFQSHRPSRLHKLSVCRYVTNPIPQWLKTISVYCPAVALGQESGPSLARASGPRSLKVAVKWSGAVVSSEGSTGGRPTSKITHMPAGRIWFLAGAWTQSLSSLLALGWRSPLVSRHVGLFIGHPRWNPQSFCNSMVEVMAYHFCRILFITAVARSSPR